jgi:hypothetical protein
MGLWDATNLTSLTGSHAVVQGPTNYSDVTNYTYCSSSGSCSASNSSYACSSSTYYYAHCVTSGKVSSGSNVSWVDTQNNCQWSYGHRCFSWGNWTLNSTHKYWILVSFTAFTWVDMYHYPPGDTLIATVDAWSPGSNGWRVNSVTAK